METFAVYINDHEHGPRQILSLLNGQAPAHWVLLTCPPRMSRHLGRWLSQPAKKKWRQRWSDDVLREVTERLRAKEDTFEVRVLRHPQAKVERELRREFPGLRLIDARRLQDSWEVPAGVAAMGTLMTLAVE